MSVFFCHFRSDKFFFFKPLQNSVYCRVLWTAERKREEVGEILYRGVPLHFIPGQAAPDSAFASLLSFRFAPLQQRLRRLALLNAKTHLTSHKITYAENQFSTFRNDFSFAVLKSETLRVTRTIPLAMAVAAI